MMARKGNETDVRTFAVAILFSIVLSHHIGKGQNKPSQAPDTR
jgi:hypothetical protein